MFENSPAATRSGAVFVSAVPSTGQRAGLIGLVLARERNIMGWLIFLLVVAAVVVGVVWAKKHFRHEIERAKRINRANKNQ
jgi:mannose/fructose/N-acetylgalactosamine-specific phosphotransferase system component IID